MRIAGFFLRTAKLLCELKKVKVYKGGIGEVERRK